MIAELQNVFAIFLAISDFILNFLFDLEELHRLIRLGVAGFGLQGLNGGLAAPVAVEEGDHGEAASRPYNKIQRKNEIE